MSPPPGRPKEGSLPEGHEGARSGPGGKARSAKGAQTKRIGLFGGTFDPPQLAHLALARCARDALPLDEVRWIPAGTPWQKTRAITDARHREAMVRLAIEGERAFVLERCELQRTGPSIMLHTVHELRQREPGAQWFLLIGADQYNNLHTWRGWRELLGLVTLAVAPRPGIEPQPDPEVAAAAHRMLPLPPQPVSASDIRARVARGESIAGLVGDPVASYIDRHHLYRSAVGH
ncbi:MAG TPA: nicotinate-nucleotide adenylyltransferase [Burkholderiaceae bacterium]|nr:nicotinate-nucleotide adenylyltransferase [Burkholderiaceae bacterium]